ncbi:MAG: hypothetical protein QFF03_03680 [Pseudomonadota bacterium]|nr:hypothetical protein [Pseudomonadota bacterium]
MEHRITVLEARWDAILPTLATKVDVAEVRTDVAQLRTEVRQQLHQHAAVAKADLAGLRDELHQHAAVTQADLAELRSGLQEQLHQHAAAANTNIAELRTELRDGLHQCAMATLALRGDMQQSFGESRTEMQKLSADIKTWTLATVLTIIGTMLAAILAISQVYKGSPTAPVIITIPGAAAVK